MSMPYINMEFGPEAKLFIEKLQAFPEVLMPAMRRGIVEGAELAAGRIQQQRLTGAGPFPVEDHALGVVSGRLRQSVRVAAGNIEGNMVTASIGSNVRYAAVHEFGYEGEVRVKPFFRKYRGRDRHAEVQRVSQKTGRRYKTKIKTASGVSQVKAHTRHMKIPARSPFGYGLADSEQLIVNAVTSQLEEAVKSLE
jgi:phage gpG-like protein